MTKYLNAKNGIEILHSDGLTQIITGSSDPSLDGAEANVGSLFLRNDLGGGIYNKIGTQDTDWELQVSSPNTSSSGITPEQHIALHNGDKFIEYIRTGARVSNINEWLDETKTYCISSTYLARDAGRVNHFTKHIYDYASGSYIVATVSGVVNRVDGKVISIKYSRDNTIGGY